MARFWDPLTYDNLMAGTVAHFEGREKRPLTDIANAPGPGIYAIYYHGALAEYQPVAGGEAPVYVGKAVPGGARTGGEALAIVPVWIVFAEQALIKQYRPVWNSCLDGFGKHAQGGRRRNTERSWWDTLHPGRPWTAGETRLKTLAGARARLREFWLRN